MKTPEDIEKLEKLIGQLSGLHSELTVLSKKSPNDALNLFKMKLVNKVLESANRFLEGGYMPFDEFRQFEEDALPTNSDVTLILMQYIEQVERFRSDNVSWDGHFKWFYVLNGEQSEIESQAATKIGVHRER